MALMAQSILLLCLLGVIVKFIEAYLALFLIHYDFL